MNHRDCYLPVAPKHTRFIDMNGSFLCIANKYTLNKYISCKRLQNIYPERDSIHYNEPEKDCKHYNESERDSMHYNELKFTAIEVLSRCHS